jgi:hypothetical protein
MENIICASVDYKKDSKKKTEYITNYTKMFVNNTIHLTPELLLNNYDSDDSNIEDDEYQFNNYTIARWAKEYNFMIMHPYNIVVREDIPPLFSYS